MNNAAGSTADLAKPLIEQGIFSTGGGVNAPYAAYLGDHLGVFAGYATESSNRAHVASGGLVTTLLATSLRDGLVDAVAVARSDFADGKLGYRFDLISDPDKVQEYGTSVYFNIPIEKYWREMDRFDGRIALCALPCHIGLLRRLQKEGRGLANVQLFLSLFCGHNNELELLRFVLRKQGIAESAVADLRVNRTYLGGHVRISLRDGSHRLIPFRNFNVYRSLWFFSKQMCRYCDDYLGAVADLSIGDIFVPEYRRRRIKHSAVIARTPRGLKLLRSAIDRGIVTVDAVSPKVVFRAQKRIIVPSGDLTSRYQACRLAGFPAKRPEQRKFRLRSFITYSLLHLNDRLSQTSWGPRLLRWIPLPLLYAYIAAIKLINNSLRPVK